jgi:hypothetical protein
VAFSKAAPPEDDVAHLAAALAEATHQTVEPEDVRWEPSRGALVDASFGRFVLFLASDKKGGPRDVWRARVRLTGEGHALAVDDVHDLTSTPLGDDHALVVRGARAAFATHAFGQEQSVSVLDLEGEGTQNTATSRLDRFTNWITNLQSTGSGEGIGRIDVTLEEPARQIGITLGDGLDLDLIDGGGNKRHARIDLARGDANTTLPGLHVEAARHLPKRFVFWAVDTARAVPWIGPTPIAWLEDKTFALRDFSRQLAYKWSGESDVETLAPTDVQAPVPKVVLDASQTGADSAHWPPTDVRSIWKTPEPGEGEWRAAAFPWMRRVPSASAAAPLPFYKTFVRPDEERPYAKVLLVAMDMRQLELGMEAGSEDPKPLTGAHGSGRIPRDPAISTRVVAAFNGAFKTEHGNYGMMVNRRVLLPPQPGAASVIVLKDQRVGLGTWSSMKDAWGIRGVADQEVVSFRQNLDALLDNGQINPNKRALWGYTLPGSGTQTERSGLCVTDSGHLVYAWGEDVNATALAKAMKMGGCVYGMHLDMNPHHTGFIFATIHELKGHNYRTELLAPKMEISPDRYIEYAAKDFFYVMVHDPSPPALTPPASAWQADGGAQPAPTWIPGIWSARATDAIELVDIEPGRATWRIRGGAKEPDPKTGAAALRELSEEEAHRVLLGASLGVSTEKHPRGLATAGRMVLPMSANATGVLVATPEGTLSIVLASELGEIAPHADAVELPLVLDGATVIPQNHEARGGSEPSLGGQQTPRAVLGTTPEGRVVIAHGPASSYILLAEALRRAGCTRAVALDRGVPSSFALHRSGTGDPPRASYDETTLSAIAVPLKPRGFRFEARTDIAAK